MQGVIKYDLFISRNYSSVEKCAALGQSHRQGMISIKDSIQRAHLVGRHLIVGEPVAMAIGWISLNILRSGAIHIDVIGITIVALNHAITVGIVPGAHSAVGFTERDCVVRGAANPIGAEMRFVAHRLQAVEYLHCLGLFHHDRLRKQESLLTGLQ